MILHRAEAIAEHTAAGYWSSTHTLLDDLAAAAREHPDRVAYADPPDRAALIGSPPRSVTWAELERAVDAAATALARHGLERDEVVVAQVPNVWELPLAYLAVARAGGILSPVPMQWRSKDISYVAALTGARYFVGPQAFKDHRPLDTAEGVASDPVLEHRIDLADLATWAEGDVDEALLAERRPGPDDVFTLCWTSGTESQPKGCPLTHNTWTYGVGNLLTALRLQPTSHRQIAVSPMTNMLGVCMGLVANLEIAGTVVLHHPMDLDLLLHQLEHETIDFLILPPAVLHLLVNLGDDAPDLSGIDAVQTGGAPPAASLIAAYQDRWGIEIINGWGMNEGAGLFAGPDDVPDPAWRSDHFPWYGREGTAWPSGIEGVRLKLVDEDGREVHEDGAVGELLVGGPSVFPGYFARRDLDPTTFDDDGFLRTGDLFAVKDGSYLSFVDRKKDIVIRGGFNISAAEVENLAVSHPDVAECAAVGYPDEVLGERLCLVVVPRDAGRPPTLESIVEHLRDGGLAVYKLPERVELAEALPRNPVGKLLKRELRARLTPPTDH
ncbi:class I adenylate-forming enzyme family protein [Aeromicrobium sp. CTD01-1L150]|uniref:class I adenylate-forming enzyme family protein n=1 Tax=Aeromicrobium sp. CTD01-1L150 TaxID=3341830 RepID=UPI0035C093BF